MTTCLGRAILSLVFACACGDDGGTEAGESGGATATGTTSGPTSSSTSGTSTSTSASETELNPLCPPTPGEWIPQTLPVGETGVAYDVEITAENWEGDVNAYVDGDLPEGLSAQDTSSGISLTGVPTEAGSFPITVHTFTGDGGNCWPPKNYELVIEQGAGTSTGSTGTGGSSGESGSTTSG